MLVESGWECAAAIAAVCQVVVGDVLSGYGVVELSGLADRFAVVPQPASYNEATMAVAVLLQFTINLGRAVHLRLHPDAAGKRDCDFDPGAIVPSVNVDPSDPSAWDARRAFATWAQRYLEAIGRTHDLLGERVRARLSQQSAQRVRASELARSLGSSKSVVVRRCVSTVGETPRQYAIRLRVADAIPLIGEGWKVDAVAARVGWSARKDLYRAVKTLTGMSLDQIRALSPGKINALAAAVHTHGSRRPGGAPPLNR